MSSYHPLDTEGNKTHTGNRDNFRSLKATRIDYICSENCDVIKAINTIVFKIIKVILCRFHEHFVARQYCVCTIYSTMKRNSAIAIRMDYGCKSLTISSKNERVNMKSNLFFHCILRKRSNEKKMKLNL